MVYAPGGMNIHKGAWAAEIHTWHIPSIDPLTISELNIKSKYLKVPSACGISSLQGMGLQSDPPQHAGGYQE